MTSSLPLAPAIIQADTRPADSPGICPPVGVPPDLREVSMSTLIINRGRGPEIAGTRITVYDILDYTRAGHHHTYIAAMLGLSSAQVLAAIEYIEEHKDEVLANYQKI